MIEYDDMLFQILRIHKLNNQKLRTSIKHNIYIYTNVRHSQRSKENKCQNHEMEVDVK